MKLAAWLPLLLLASLAQDPGMEDLIQGLGAKEIAAREKAAKSIGERWEQWSDRELGLLRTAASSSDTEVASQAKGALQSILSLRRFAVHLPVRITKNGSVSVAEHEVAPSEKEIDAAGLAEAFKAYAKIPADPKGKRIFTGVRLFIEMDRSVPFSRLHKVLQVALANASVSEVVLLDPAPKEGDRAPASLVLTVPRIGEAKEDVDWKEKFVQELNYHYQTQQIKNAEIEELNKTAGELREKVARLERELKEKK